MFADDVEGAWLKEYDGTSWGGPAAKMDPILRDQED